MLALFSGLTLGGGAKWTEDLTLPALAVVMTVSCMSIPFSIFRSPRDLLVPALSGITLNSLVLGGFFFFASEFFVRDADFRNGFFLLATVPPGVAVIPFTVLLNGNSAFSLIGTMSAYFGALIIMPITALCLFGTNFAGPVELFAIVVELIAIPLLLAFILVKTGLSKRIDPIKGAITNWGFFVVIYTIVGLNREVFFGRPLSLVPVAGIGIASTFLLGVIIERVGTILRISSQTVTSIILLGTIKNYGIAGGIALALFNKETAVPASITVVCSVLYFMWLGFKQGSRAFAASPLRN
jgi:BASS family bile acid:Na+ symporter